MIHSNILSLVGNTPLVELSRLNTNPKVRVAAKIESKNIGGSIKDRVALAMVEAAEKSGELTPGKTVIEATSGNTGVGLAMVCAVKGHKLLLLMPESASEERKRIMRAYGAELKLTPGRLKTDGAIEEAYRLAREEPDTYVLMDQYNNEASVQAHYETTAKEIWRETEGKVTHVITTLGTSGTAMGLCKRFHELNPDVHVIAVEPFAGHRIQGLKNMVESYPPGIYDKNQPSDIVHVEDEDAFETCRRMAREEGLLVGMSSGAACSAALKIASGLESGLVVFICPDSGERYLSTDLFAAPEQQGVKVLNVADGSRTLLPAPTGNGPAIRPGFFTPGPASDALGELEAWRRIVLLDVLVRSFRERGVDASAAVTLVDMDDRALKTGRDLKLSSGDFSSHAVEELHRMAALLKVSQDVAFVPASTGRDRSLALCRALLAKGLAYEKLRSVYFDISRDADYGQLMPQAINGMAVGKTVDLDDYSKDNPQDFTLLKRATLQDLKLGDILETEWGNVRPSWFLQHAAATLETLPTVTAVLAAESQQFPHLENFRAIWQSGAGITPKAWMLCRPLVDNELNPHTTTIDDALSGPLDGLSLRLWLLSTSYGKPLGFSKQGLAMWARNRRKLQDLFISLHLYEGGDGPIHNETGQAVYDLKSGLSEAIEDDLGLHTFWPVLFNFTKTMNTLMAQKHLSGQGAETARRHLLAVDRVLGILDADALPLAMRDWPHVVRGLVEKRESARAAKDFATADALRDQLLNEGYRVEDAPGGARIYQRG